MCHNNSVIHQLSSSCSKTRNTQIHHKMLINRDNRDGRKTRAEILRMMKGSDWSCPRVKYDDINVFFLLDLNCLIQLLSDAASPAAFGGMILVLGWTPELVELQVVAVEPGRSQNPAIPFTGTISENPQERLWVLCFKRFTEMTPVHRNAGARVGAANTRLAVRSKKEVLCVRRSADDGMTANKVFKSRCSADLMQCQMTGNTPGLWKIRFVK